MALLSKHISDFYDYKKILTYACEEAGHLILFDPISIQTMQVFMIELRKVLEVDFQLHGIQTFLHDEGNMSYKMEVIFHAAERYFLIDANFDIASSYNMKIDLTETTYQVTNMHVLSKLAEE